MEKFTIANTSKKACRSGKDAGGIYSATYSAKGACEGFQHFCGKVIGYQKGSPSAFIGGTRSLERDYLEGISITYGKPRKHLYSLAVGLTATFALYQESNCPCSKYLGRLPPAYVHDDYYCDSGNPGAPTVDKFYPDNPLWDGEGCSMDYSCCG